MNAGDTAWMLMSTALVMLMLPGLALFYGGLVRRKNVLSTIMHSFFGLAIVTVVWVVLGFSLAFAPSTAASASSAASTSSSSRRRAGAQRRLRGADPLRPLRVVPDDVRGHHAGAHHAAPSPSASASRPSSLFTILWSTPRLLAAGAQGLGAGRLAASWARSTSPAAPWSTSARASRRWSWPWSWAGASGRPRHGAARRAHDRPGRRPALVRLVRLQRRLRPGRQRPGRPGPHGTTTAAAAAALTWVCASYAPKRKVSVVGAAAGAVAGLVAITPAAGYVTVGGAVVIGLVAGGALLRRDAAA